MTTNKWITKSRMKKMTLPLMSCILLICLSACGTSRVKINKSNFPDDAFRACLLSMDEGKDRVLTEQEIASIKSLDVSNKEIKSLDGLHYFSYLEELQCGNNQLRELDVSELPLLSDLFCYSNEIAALELSNNLELTDLRCHKNKLKSLDVSKNQKLMRLYCSDNGFEDIDIDNNPELLDFVADCGQFDFTQVLVTYVGEYDEFTSRPPTLGSFVEDFSKVLLYFNDQTQLDFKLGSLEYEQEAKEDAKYGWDGTITATYGPNGKEFGILGFVDRGTIEMLFTFVGADLSSAPLDVQLTTLDFLCLPCFLYNEKLQTVEQLFFFPELLAGTAGLVEETGTIDLSAETIKALDVEDTFGEGLGYRQSINPVVPRFLVYTKNAERIMQATDSTVDSLIGDLTEEKPSESSPNSEMKQYTGKLIYVISDAGYYHLELDVPITINGYTHEHIHFPNYKDGELTDYLGSTVKVEGVVEEDFHGLLSMYEPTILSVESSDPGQKELEQKLYQMGFESTRGRSNQSEAERIANAYFAEKESDAKYALYGQCDSIYGGDLVGGYLYLPVTNGKMTVESEFLYVYPYDNVIYQGYFMSEYYCVWKDGVIEKRSEIALWVEQLLGAEVSCRLIDEPIYCVNNMNDEWFSVSWDGSKVYYHGNYLSDQGAEIYPNDTIGYFSSNQDAIHKCIFCSAEAYPNGEHWLCNSCCREYSLDAIAEKVNFDTFKAGTWWDMWSQRCNMKLEILDDYTVSIEINWTSGASENTTWTMVGTWDSKTSLLSYENGVKKTIVYSEGGAEQVVDSYDDGSGIFYFASGYLHWLDLKEAAGFDCMFEYSDY